ncbi:MAG: hypothetical protein RLZ18_841 [Actinomycetota bacterium]
MREVREQITAAGGHHVQLIAVTKTFGVDAINAAVHSGCDAIGENYAQELHAKVLEGLPDIPVHFIGAIQSNKVKLVAPYVSVWHTVDRPSVITELSRRVPGARVLLQVNTTGEPTKGGLAPADVADMCAVTVEAGLALEGLMTIGPTHGSSADQESAFRLLRRLADQNSLIHCSMGMSDDFPIAVACGSTMVRVGSRLFGSRATQ